MEQLKEQLAKIKSQLHRLLTKIEGSPLFEKLVFKYESLEPRQQEWARFLGKVSVIALISFLMLKPLLSSFQRRSHIDSLYELNSAVKQFNRELAQKKQGYVAPQGWQSFDASSVSALQDAIATYLAQIGISEDFYDILPQNDSLSLKITELSIRQLTALSFQIDGFFPVAYFSQFQTSVNPNNKELLQFDGIIEYKANLADQLPKGGIQTKSSPAPVARTRNVPIEVSPPPQNPLPSPTPERRKSPMNNPSDKLLPLPSEPRDFDDSPPPDLLEPPGIPGGPGYEDEFIAPELMPPEFPDEDDL